jgi:hypothetical protein
MNEPHLPLTNVFANNSKNTQKAVKMTINCVARGANDEIHPYRLIRNKGWLGGAGNEFDADLIRGGAWVLLEAACGGGCGIPD